MLGKASGRAHPVFLVNSFVIDEILPGSSVDRVYAIALYWFVRCTIMQSEGPTSFNRGLPCRGLERSRKMSPCGRLVWCCVVFIFLSRIMPDARSGELINFFFFSRFGFSG